MATAIDLDATLGDLVTARPALARELERRGLDYCCGGAMTLRDACGAHALDPEAVAADLAEVSAEDAPEEWTTYGPARLVDHIVGTHHRYLWDEMPRLSALLGKVVAVHGARHSELGTVQQRYEELRADLEPHLRKEEQVLFPMIRQLATAQAKPSFHGGSVANPIAVMRSEHDRAGDLLAEIRRVTDGYRVPQDGCASYRACYEALDALEADTHLHVHKENNRLFPTAIWLEDQIGELL